MVARKVVRGSIRSADAAELLGDALGVLAHDLGGVVATLELRAESLAATPGSDDAGLRAVAEEVRDATRLLRLLRGPRGGDALAPARGLATSGWWRLVARLTRSVLPRGTVVSATCGAGEFTPGEATGLAWAWLAACKHLASLHPSVPLTITVGIHPAGPAGEGATLTARCEPWPGAAIAAETNWQRFVSRLPGVAVDWWSPDGAGARCNVRIAAGG